MHRTIRLHDGVIMKMAEAKWSNPVAPVLLIDVNRETGSRLPTVTANPEDGADRTVGEQVCVLVVIRTGIRPPVG